MARVTMRDVAEKAGVSVATVSNVINKIEHKTTKETRDKVLATIKKLNYQVDMTARALSRGKSNLIGVFFPQVFENGQPASLLRDNPFYVEILSGIEYESRLKGYDLVISSISNAEELIELQQKRTLDGIVLLGSYDEGFWKKVSDLSIPLVLIDSYSTKGHGNVGIDDELGAYLATMHLITLGHRKIIFATGEINTSEVNRMRYEGFKRAIKESKIDENQCKVIEGVVSFKGGNVIAQRILKDYNDITAIFVTADIMAFGIVKVMNQFGKKIPDDISIIGFDDLVFCEYSYPGLTTIRQDIYRKGIEAARLVIKIVENKDGINNIVLPVELITRETTKSIKN